MEKYKMVAAALMLLFGLDFSAKAQSPWESGGFKGYDQTAPSTPSGDNAIGLQGFSLSPNVEEPSPTAPTYQAQPQSEIQSPASLQPVPQTTALAPRTADPNISPSRAAMQAGAADTVFLSMAQQGTMALVQTSQLAHKNATSDMQQFADQILSIYGGMQSELAALMKKNNVATSNIPMPSSISRLQDKTGVDFDKQYIQIQMEQFYMLSSAFKKEADMGQNEALKAYAANHLSMIDQQKDTVQKSYMNLIGQGASPMGASR